MFKVISVVIMGLLMMGLFCACGSPSRPLIEYPGGFSDNTTTVDSDGNTVVEGIVSAVKIEQVCEFVSSDYVYFSDGRVLRVDIAPCTATSHGLQIGAKYRFTIKTGSNQLASIQMVQ